MSDERDPIEELFRKSADDRDYPFRESDWKEMEARLDYNMPRPGHNLSGQLLIALLILSTPWWPWKVELPQTEYPAREIHEVTRPGHQATDPEPARAVQGSADKAGDNAELIADADAGTPPALSGESPAGIGENSDNLLTTGGQSEAHPVTSGLQTKPGSQAREGYDKFDPAGPETGPARAQKRETFTALALASRGIYPLDIRVRFPFDFRGPTLVPVLPAGMGNQLTAGNTENTGMRFRPYVLLGTELGGTDLNRRPRYGGRVGIGLRYLPVPQISLDVAALYSQVAYTAFGEEYKMPEEPQPNPYPPTLQWTDGACEMIEIPVEIRWHATSWLNIGTGLRSYIVLREQYELHFTDYYGGGFKMPYEWEEPYSAWTPHLIFSAGAMIPMGRYNMEIQPFYQMPLRGVGQGSVEWKSAGVSVLILF